jgi:hypothetical protein
VTVEHWLQHDNKALAAALQSGHAVPAEGLYDSRYLGISLGLPGWVDRMAWKTFEKDFHWDPESGQLRGWNVRLQQTGWLDAPVAQKKAGQPVTFGHFHVVPGHEGRRSEPVNGSLLLDYGAGGNAVWDPVTLLRDPLVAVVEGSVDRLLGWTWLDFGLFTTGTPSFFLLQRIGSLEHVVARLKK